MKKGSGANSVIGLAGDRAGVAGRMRVRRLAGVIAEFGG
jgi:hypothetical protein